MSSDADVPRRAVLELIVDDYPGVMSHVCGLFARRAFNLDGILCLPEANGGTSRIWLRVLEGERLDQIENQLRKLTDVRALRRHGPEHTVFRDLEAICREC